ncbi:MAG: hypothetical protein AB7F75_09105 [Planctomycetota bacterium]
MALTKLKLGFKSDAVILQGQISVDLRQIDRSEIASHWYDWVYDLFKPSKTNVTSFNSRLKSQVGV